MAIQMLNKIFKPRRIAPRLVTEAGFKADESVADPVRRTQEYAPLDTLSFWAEAHTNGPRWQAGLWRHIITFDVPAFPPAPPAHPLPVPIFLTESECHC